MYAFFSLFKASLIASLVMLTSCFFEADEFKIINLDRTKSSDNSSTLKVSSVVLVDDQLIVDGSNLAGITQTQIKGESMDHALSVTSKTDSRITYSSSSSLALVLNSAFDLIFTDAHGATVVSVTFNLADSSVSTAKIGDDQVTTAKIADGAITAQKLSSMGATNGHILKYDGSSWIPGDLGALIYAGTWDASSGVEPNSSPTGGEYYIVDVSDTGVDLGDGEGARDWEVGDWIIYNGETFQWNKISNASYVTSFNSRSGAITPEANDYTWAQIDKSSAPIGDLSDVNVTGATSGSVLKYDGSNWVVGTDNDTAGSGTSDLGSSTNSTINADSDGNGSGAISFQVNSSEVGGFSNNGNFSVDTNTLVVDASSNRVGIGVLAPSYDLSFSGETDKAIGAERHTTSDTEGSDFYVYSSGATVGATDKNGGDLLLASGTSTGSGSSNIYFGTASAGASGTADNDPTTKMTILGNGNVGIGVLSPATKLAISAGADDAITSFSSSDNKAELQLSDDDTTTYIAAENSLLSMGLNSGANANNLNIDSSGNIGIGTILPSGKLDIEGGDVFIGTGTLTNASGSEDLSLSGNLEVDGIIYGDGSGITNLPSGTVTSITGGAGLSDGPITNSGTIDVNVDGATIEINADALRVKDGGITNAKIDTSAAIDYSKLNIADGNLTIAKTSGLQTSLDAKVAIIRSIASGNGLSGGGDLSSDRTLAVNVDDSTIEINTDTLRVKDSGITDAKINSVAHTKVTTACTDGQILSASSGNLVCANSSSVGNWTLSGSDIYYNGGNVGIGTNSPGSSLHVRLGVDSGSIGKFANEDATLLNIASVGTGNHRLGQVSLYGSNDISGTRGVGGIIHAETGNSKTQVSDAVMQFNVTESGGSVSAANLFNWSNNDSQVMTIDNSGNVGIGTTSPQGTLEVNDGATLAPAYASSDRLIVNSNANTVVNITSPSTHGGYLYFSDPSDRDAGGISYSHVSDNMSFRVNGAIRTTIDSSGNIGIGTASPAARVDIKGKGDTADDGLIVRGASGVRTARLWVDGTSDTAHVTGGNGTVRLIINGAGGRVGVGELNPLGDLDIGDGSSGFPGLKLKGKGFSELDIAVPTTERLQIGHHDGTVNGGTTRLVVDTSGDVGIGTTSPGYKLDVNGTIRGFGITDSSDERLKNNIEPLQSSLDKILELEGVSYYWNEDLENREEDKQIGLIAQDVEKIYPELVETDSQGMKSVNYSHLTSPLIEALKELYAQFKVLFSSDIKQNRKIASIERENKEIRLENEQMKSESREIKKENQEIKAVLCEVHPSASFCQSE